LAEWLYEAGTGEERAALVEGDTIVEALIAVDDGGLRVGGVHDARLAEGGQITIGRHVATLNRVPAGLSIGAALRVEIVREVIPEPGRTKPARAIATDEPPRPAPTLLDRIAATGIPVRRLHAYEPDTMEAAGWSETLDEAVTGDIAFAGGALRMSPTPAMTLFDVDGHGDLDALSIAAARAVARAIRRHGIGGSIGIDFPTLTGKAPRQAVAQALDEALPPPFERTAVNGFGFLQIVRPRPRASLPELLRADPVGAAARAALRMIERTPPDAPRVHALTPIIRTRLAAEPAWLAEVERRTGRPISLA
jgi:ribonuclease G